MCSSPKSSTTRRRYKRNSSTDEMGYEQYSQMVRRASAVYEAKEQRMAKRKQELAEQQATLNQEKTVRIEIKPKPTLATAIKKIFTQPITFRGVTNS